MSVTKEKQEQLIQRMEKLGIKEIDLLERFILGSGPGGQKINKSSSCVHLHHLPTAIEIKCQMSRSQALNRYYARKLLCDKIEEISLEKKSKAEQEREKIRRQKKRRSRKQKEKMLQEKKRRSLIKENRKSTDPLY